MELLKGWVAERVNETNEVLDTAERRMNLIKVLEMEGPTLGTLGDNVL